MACVHWVASAAYRDALIRVDVRSAVATFRQAEDEFRGAEAVMIGEVLWTAETGEQSLLEITDEFKVTDYLMNNTPLGKLTANEWGIS